MATRTSTANPIATFYEAQTAATAEIAQAALNGMQRLQKLTLEAMRAGAGEQFSLAQSMATMRDGGNLGNSISKAAVPAAEQTTRYQREMVQAIAEMNNNVLRASYSMMERMRDAFETATQGSMPLASAMPALPISAESMTNPMAMVDSAMRHWQAAVQQMMERPVAAKAAASTQEDRPRTSSGTALRKSKRAAKRKSRSAR